MVKRRGLAYELSSVKTYDTGYRFCAAMRQQYERLIPNEDARTELRSYAVVVFSLYQKRDTQGTVENAVRRLQATRILANTG